MKPLHFLMLGAVFSVFVATFMLSTGFLTGFVVADTSVGLKVDGVKVSGNSAILSWNTNTDSVSTLHVANSDIAFTTATEFEKEIAGLTAGEKYNYRIRACNREQCEEQSGSFVAGRGGSLITGAAFSDLNTKVGDTIGGFTNVNAPDIGGGLRTIANFALLLVVVGAVVFVAGKITYPGIGTKDEVSSLLKNANNHLSNEQFDEANIAYASARQAFMELEDEARLKHYDGLMKVYQNLRRHYDINEAQLLADKYAQGTISQEELQRLNELIVS